MTPEYIMISVGEALGHSQDDFYKHGISRSKQSLVDLRCITTVLIRKYVPSFTYKMIAKLYGGMDHTTIINYTKIFEDRIFTNDDEFIEKYSKAVQQLRKSKQSLHVAISNYKKLKDGKSNNI